VTLLDARKHAVISTIQLGEKGVIKPMSVVVSRDGGTAYVSSGRGKNVYMLDTATNKVSGSVEVGKRPWGIAVSPDGKTLFAADGPSNEVVVVDLDTKSVKKRIKAGDSPWGVITLQR
jgi:YVTN family beta-propeller protein